MSDWITKLRTGTKAIAVVILAIGAALQTDTVQQVLAPIVGAHPKLAAALAAFGALLLLLHNPELRKLLGLPPEDTKAKSAGQAGYTRLGGAAIVLLACTLVLLAGAWSCATWERQTFQVLSASKAAIDCAGAKYNADAALMETYCAADARTTIAQTSANRELIERGRQVQRVAVIAFRDWRCLAYPSKPAPPELAAYGPCVSLAPGERPSADRVAQAQQKAMTAVAFPA
ncbi:MAG: hypothetical protein ACE14L_04825 [Terriglobales bacterium]